MEIVIIGLLVISIILPFIKKKDTNPGEINLDEIKSKLHLLEQEIKTTREVVLSQFGQNRQDANNAFKTQRDEIKQEFTSFNDNNEKLITKLNEDSQERIGRVRDVVAEKLEKLNKDNSKELLEIRTIVDEKLQKTINDRLSQSFKTVGEQLIQVQQGLGEMKNIASDVGSLKKVLGNVKLRGGIGEVQLEMLLEQILAPDQYEKNVMTKKGSQANVEFAIKLPGKGDSNESVYLPIDAKFPKDVYEQLLEAYEDGSPEVINSARSSLQTTIKNMAKDISSKYLDPPHTTNFGIMFLPFEAIYSEVVRDASLLETIQREYKVVITGPATLASLLNSLQMGFRTLALEKRSSEVWTVLGKVKKEFENFGGIMQKAQKNIQTGLNQLDDVMGKRTRAIDRALRDVETVENEIDTRFVDNDEIEKLN